MKFGILNIGDELLAGKILNTNQVDLARLLRPLGHDVLYGLVIGDDENQLVEILESALGAERGSSGSPVATRLPKVDFLILTGGLGPTQDDLTRQAAAAYLGVPLVQSPQGVEWLCGFLKKTLAEMQPSQLSQACVPRGTEPLRNPAGTACGFRFRTGPTGRGPAEAGTTVLAFPGVPSELDAMARLHLLPGLPSDQLLLERGVWTWGWSEGSQRQALQGFALPTGFRFSSLPGERGVRISLQCLCAPVDRPERESDLDALWATVISAIPTESLIDAGGADLPQAVFQLLRSLGATVSLAESCTGGGLGYLITEIAGSSEVFRQGYLTYADEAKTDLLGVDPSLLGTHGAVSEAVALAMAKGCLERSGADFACAVTGIAGPTGGTPAKPVGTVWIAVASKEHAQARLYQFRGDRKAVRSRSCYSALNQLRLFLQVYSEKHLHK
jgi:nicotinamide-nucleotide amidase